MSQTRTTGQPTPQQATRRTNKKGILFVEQPLLSFYPHQTHPKDKPVSLTTAMTETYEDYERVSAICLNDPEFRVFCLPRSGCFLRSIMPTFLGFEAFWQVLGLP
jgi:hypothetical protein